MEAKRIYGENRAFEAEPEPFKFAPQLLLCGYDENHVPTIGRVESGTADPSGFDADYDVIGSAEDIGRWMLRRVETVPTDRLHKVLYACYEAKRQSDLYDGISQKFYAWVLVRDHESPIPVAPAIIAEMRRTWGRLNAAARPFGRREAQAVDWSHLRESVEDWFRSLASSPTEPSRPSSRSRTGGRR